MISFCLNNIANGKPGITFHQAFYDAVKPPVPPTRFAIPGTVQAEGYSAQSGIQKETTTDTGGGQNIGFIEAGDWADYLVNVQTAGNYQVQYRVASTGTTGQVQLRNGTTTYATTSIPNTGGWQTWTTVTATASLPAGNHTLRLHFSGGGFNLNWIGFATSTGTPPAAPANLTATAGNAQVSLSWTASSGATSYTVKRSTTSGGPYTDVASGITGTSYTNTGLTNGTTYYFVVTASNSGGQSGNSNQASATPVNNTTINPYVTMQAESYSSMQGIQTEACSDTGGGQNVGYTDANDYIAFNNVNFGTGAGSVDVRMASAATFTGTAQFRLGSTTGTLVGTVSFGSTGGWQTWTTKNVAISGATGTQNLYMVFLGGSGIGNVNWIKFNTGGTTAPSAPTNLSATPGNTQVSLTWSASAGATSYTVKRSGTSGGPYTNVATGLTTTSYTNTGLTNGTVYYYVVSASNTAGQSANSTQVSTTPTASSTIANGVYKITVASNLKSLDVADVSTANGARIQQWDYTGGNNQRWRIESLGGGLYRISAVHSNKALDVVDNSTANGAEIQQWDYTGGANQKWRIEDQGSGFYRIVASHSNKVLNSPSTANGARITQTDWTNTDNQKWRLEFLSAARLPASGASAVEEESENPEHSFLAEIYPNPGVSKAVKVKLTGNVETTIMTVTNSNGRVVWSKHVKESLEDVEISDLVPGLYIIQIQNGAEKITERLIIE
jgi:fibronectin type 3 domain-containing protein